MEATRALNQAIGRIIRHVHDFGAILLCDERCAAANLQQSLSCWVQQRLQVADSFDSTLRDLSHFFGSSVQVRILPSQLISFEFMEFNE